jgi:hypothetical protein
VVRLAAAIVILILFLLVNSQTGFAFILIDDPGPRVDLPATERGSETYLRDLIENLETITGLHLYIEKGYLRVKPLDSMFSWNPLFVMIHDTFLPTDQKWSTTARSLLLSAIKSDNVYRVRGAREADFGRVYRGGSIELDFTDLKDITFRDVPRETFNAGMIFLHELVHRHLGLLDPSPDEVKDNPDVRGDTVEYVNKIEGELGLPERLHYFPKRSLDKRNSAFCIYFGRGSDRIELDEDLFAKKFKNRTQNGYLGLLRKR